MRKRNHALAKFIATAIGCLTIAASGYAQKLEKGYVETTGQVGIVTGIGTHASLSGSIGTAVTDRVVAFGEFGWIPLGGTNVTTITTPGNTLGFTSSGRILTFMGGAHYYFRETRSFIPYAGGALGLVHGSGSTSQTVGGITAQSSFTTNHLYVSFGGGARYYVTDRWGFKPEFMIFAGDDTFFRFGAGAFYQW